MLKLSFPTRKLKGSLIKITDKYKNFEGKNLPAYGVTNKEGVVITGKDVSDDTSNYTVVSGKAFVYNPYRINIGSIGLTNDSFEGIVSPAYVVFKVKEDIHPEFLLLYLKSSLGINLIKWYGDRGGVRSALRFNDLEKIDFPDLSYQQQEKALKEIEQFIKIQEEFNTEIENQANYISKLRQSILQDAIQGKLVPQNPNDEPASVLLNRIITEKEQLIKEGKIKKEKPLPQITEDEIPFEIPDLWEWCRLGSILAKLTDGTHKTPTYTNDGIPFLSVKDMSSGKLNFSNTKFVSKEEHEILYRRCNPEKGDLLVTKIGTTGIPVIVDTEKEFSLFVSVALLKFNKELINIKYLYYMILSPIVAEQAKANTKGVGNQNWVIDKIAQTVITIPPLAEQKRIVDKVEELMELCDKLETENIYSQNLSSNLLESMMHKYFNAPLKINANIVN